MKKLAIFIFSIAIAFGSLAQEYIPIPADSTAHWKIFGSKVLDETCVRYFTNWLYIEGDTVINDKTFNAVFSKGHWNDSPIGGGSCSGSGTTYGVYEGAILTEDSLIYIAPRWSNVELLFNYNLTTGDTLPDSLYILKNVDPYYSIIIDSIDSIQTISGNYLKRWNFSMAAGNYYSTWNFIESIGTEKGLMYNYFQHEFQTEFICYSEEYEPVYPAGSNCDPTVYLQEEKTFKIKFYAFPNPFTTSTTIEYELTEPQTITFTFYDAYGRTVDIITKHQQQGTQKLVWKPERLKEGMYNFKLAAERTFHSGKVILVK